MRSPPTGQFSSPRCSGTRSSRIMQGTSSEVLPCLGLGDLLDVDGEDSV